MFDTIFVFLLKTHKHILVYGRLKVIEVKKYKKNISF